jgi:hypothetical protein
MGLTSGSHAQREGVTGVFMGTVTTPSGMPVPNAQILVIPADRALVGRQNRHRTDQEGTFRLRLPVGHYWVRVAAVGFVPHWYEDAQSRNAAVPVVIYEPGVEVVWPVVVRPIASVSGQVTDALSGQGIEDGVVLFQGLNTRLSKRAAIANGYFISEGLIPGAYRIQVLAGGYVAAEAIVTLASGDNLGPVQIALSKGLSISGVVTGQNGVTLEGAIISARSVVRDDRLQGGISLADGRYQISGLLPGSYTIVAKKVGFESTYFDGKDTGKDATVLRLGEGQTQEGIDFVLGQVGAIVGKITDAQNQPIIGARIIAEPVGEGQRKKARSGKDGHYVLAHVANGAYRVRAVANGYAPLYYDGVQTNGEATWVSVTDDAHTEAVDFVLLAGGKIIGKVRDKDSGKSIGDARVTARWFGHQGVWQTQSDALGNFELGDLPDGSFLLQGSARRYVTEFYGHSHDLERAKQLSVKAGETRLDIELDLARRQPGDFDGNGEIDFKDLMQLVHHLMGRKEFDDQLDLKQDGEVGLPDLQAFVRLPAAKTVASRGKLQWRQIEDDPSVLVGELALDHLPASTGYFLQLNYNSELAELLGVDKPEAGVFSGHSLLVNRYNGTVLVALDAENTSVDEEGGVLLRLRFRLKTDATSVPVDVASAWLSAEGAQLVQLAPPEIFTLEVPPKAFRLMQNVPNPFNPATTISFELPEAVDVDVAVYNLVGQRLRTLVNEKKAPGRYEVVWDGKDDSERDVSSGVYFYRYRAGEFWATRRMMLVR